MNRTFLRIAATTLIAGPVLGQLSERPGTSTDTSRGPKDLSGLSIKTPRIRVPHTEDETLQGGSYWLQTRDPFLAFKWGKDMTQREFQPRHGAFEVQNPQGFGGFQGRLTDGSTPAITNNDQLSCGGCHNMPYRDAGAGTNFAKKSGVGRNSTHFYGSGLQEMLAWQIRQKLMQQIDVNENNWVDLQEMNAQRLRVRPTPESDQLVDYGTSHDGDGDGWPDLNNIFRVWFVDSNGAVLPNATSLNDPGVAGYNFVMEVFGWGERRFNLNTTNRIFTWDPWESHSGLEVHDPTMTDDPENDGFGQVSNAGFVQCWIGHRPPDAGNSTFMVGSFAISSDDPDGDGFLNELTEGDIDLAEWYLVNSPRPAVTLQDREIARGLRVFEKMGCAECHVYEWEVEAARPQAPNLHERTLGDLRFFDLDVRWNARAERLEGRLVRLYDIDPGTGEYVRRRGAFRVVGIGTDFKHHEMGPEFEDLQYDGAKVTAFRTGLLWGNGRTGYPWGHDGLSLSLHDVVERHGGDAAASREAYRRAGKGKQRRLLEFLEAHVLYSTDQIPVDVDGDGVIASNFIVAGKDTGMERFNPEWLFRVPGEIEGPIVAPDGRSIVSFALVNLVQAYGLNLPGLVDSDDDCWPDVLDQAPGTPGYKDGASN